MNKKIGAIVIGLVMVIVLGLFFMWRDKTGPVLDEKSNAFHSNNENNQIITREPITFSESASYPEKSLDDLIYESDAIVVGRFASVFPSKWNTPNGELPPDANWQTVNDQSLYIYTEYSFQVNQFLKGDTFPESIIIRTLGGQVGIDRMTTGDYEIYEIGQTYLLFLHIDPRLVSGNDPVPFFVFHQGIFRISDGVATSRQERRDSEELKNYITNSSFATSKSNIPDSPEVAEVINKVKIVADLEVEAREIFDPEKFKEVFINDPRFPVNSETLEFIKNSTINPSLETAGYLDYKIAEYTDPDTRMNDRIYLSSIWIKFVSVNINNGIASVIIEPGERGRFELTLVQNNGEWFIAGMRGITIYDEVSPPSVIDPGIPQTPEYLDVIHKVEESYDVYAEAIHTLDTTKLSNIYANDEQYIANSETLDIIRNSIQNSNIQTAGYFDYKLAYISGWKTPPEWSKSPYREQILVFSGVKIEENNATVYFREWFETITLHLIKKNGEWFIAGEEGVTVSP